MQLWDGKIPRMSLSPPSFLRAGRFPLSQPENHINANICETNIRDKVYYCLFGFGQEGQLASQLTGEQGERERKPRAKCRKKGRKNLAHNSRLVVTSGFGTNHGRIAFPRITTLHNKGDRGIIHWHG